MKRSTRTASTATPNPTSGSASAPCAVYTSQGGSIPDGGLVGSPSDNRLYWIYLLQPYTKSYAVFKCPDAPNAFTSDTATNAQTINPPTGTQPGATGVDYGGQNSYGHNDMWMSPAAQFAGGAAGVNTDVVVTNASVPRPSSTILACDATYYGAVPDVGGQSGQGLYEGDPSHPVGTNGSGDTTATQETTFVDNQGTGGFYENYWRNIGNSAWDYQNTSATAAEGDNGLIAARHTGFINCQFVDGHVKALRYNDVIHNICLWTTDLEGQHPGCN